MTRGRAGASNGTAGHRLSNRTRPGLNWWLSSRTRSEGRPADRPRSSSCPQPPRVPRAPCPGPGRAFSWKGRKVMSNRALRSVVTGAVRLGLLAWGTGELYATMAQKGSVSGKVLGADGKPAVGLGLRMEQEVPMGMQKPGNKAAWGDAGPNPLQNRDGGNKEIG